jgi:hypothetical protein
VNDPALVAMRNRVTVTPQAGAGGRPGSPTRVTVRLKGGEMLTACVNALVVTPDDKLREQRRVLESKFRGLLAPEFGERRATQLIDLIDRFGELKSVRELTSETCLAY